MRIWRAFAVAVLCVIAGFGVNLATTLEEDYMLKTGWIPLILSGTGTIQDQHNSWHQLNSAGSFNGRDFLDFHRELLAQSDDFRIYGSDAEAVSDPDPAIIPVLALNNSLLPASRLKFGHGIGNPASCPRQDDHRLDDGTHNSFDPLAAALCQAEAFWTPRPANLQLGDALFRGYSVDDLGVNVSRDFHNQAHGAIARHKPFDIYPVLSSVKDAAFYQWHKNLDTIYADWAIDVYRGAGNVGLPILFSVDAGAVGSTAVGVPNSLDERRQSDVYQGGTPPGANQYGAIPRIASDIYVGNNNHGNLLFASGVRKWKLPTDPGPNEAWDIDAWTVLNLRRQGAPSGWYFSVTADSVGKAGSATADPLNVSKKGDIFEDSGGNSNSLVRSEADLGLATADNLDALEVDQQRRVQGTNDPDALGVVAPGVYDRPKQWFSLRSGTTYGVMGRPRAGGAAVAVGPGDILRFDENGYLVIDVTAAELGIGADDLDALVISDEDTSNTLSTGDLIYYSLAKPSATAAEVFCKTMGPPFNACGGKTADSLGLLATDDLDALDVRRGSPGVAGLPVYAGALARPAAASAASLLLFDEPGACCQPNGTCVPDIAPTACVGAGFTFAGPDTACDAARCPSAPGACCASTGACTVVTDRACALAAGTFRGPNTTCPPIPACPVAPSNDECANATVIPYNFSSGFEPPADNTNASISPWFRPPSQQDPPYSCSDHKVFSGPHGSGTIWYSITVPTPGPGRSIVLSTQRAAQFYPLGGGAGDTRIAMYFSSSGTCSTLQEVACADNIAGDNTWAGYYAPLRYNNPAPGKYYIQLSTVFNVDRGRTYLTVTDPNPLTPTSGPTSTPRIPAVSPWGLAFLTLVLMGAGAIVLRWRW